jgi:hypothetical protein
VNIPPALIQAKAIADQANGNCGVCVHVRNGYPHIAVADNAVHNLKCSSLPAGFAEFPPDEMAESISQIEVVEEANLGFSVYSDGTGGYGTIEITSKSGDEGSHCNPASTPPPYVIGTFNYYVQSGVTDSAFTQTVSVTNNPVPSHTVITFPLLDAIGSAFPILSSVWNYGAGPGVTNDHPTAMEFGVDVSGHWSIINLDGAAFPMGATFNVEMAPSSDSSMFWAPPSGPNFRRAFQIPSIMNHDSQALLFPVNEGYAPDGVSTVGTAYSTAQSQWILWNMSSTQIPDNANFAVRMIGAPSSYSYAQQPVSGPSNTVNESLYLDNSFGLNPLSRLFVAPIYQAGSIPYSDGPIVAAPLGLWWTGSQWAIWRQDGQAIPQGATFNAYWHRPAIIAAPTAGDSTGDKKADIMLIGGSLSTMPIAASVGDGHGFSSPTTGSDPSFPSWAQVGKPIAGDFDGDGRSDVALTGVNGWSTVPVAFSQGDGGYRVTNLGVRGVSVASGFPFVPDTYPGFIDPSGDDGFTGYAGQPGANPIGGDFNGDGLQDIALLTVPGVSQIPIAFSRGNGTFRGITRGVETGDTNFTSYAAQGAKVAVGDFNGDGRADIALTGVSWWNTIPVAFSNGDGSFNATNFVVDTVPERAGETGGIVLAGDFDGDGKADIAVVGDSSCEVTLALSNGDGHFHIVTSGYSLLACMYSWHPSAKAFAGDFNGDGKTDIGLAGTFFNQYGQYYQLVTAVSHGDGTFDWAESDVEATTTDGLVAAAVTSGAAVLSASPASPYLRNLARGMPATQAQPTLGGGDPSRAVDGNPDGNWYDGSVTHTEYLSQPWWQVDLGADHYVKSIDIFNRTDCCAERLTDFKIVTSLSNGTPTSSQTFSGTGARPTSLAIEAQARYVTISLLGTDYLSLAEVYVWGP